MKGESRQRLLRLSKHVFLIFSVIFLRPKVSFDIYMCRLSIGNLEPQKLRKKKRNLITKFLWFKVANRRLRRSSVYYQCQKKLLDEKISQKRSKYGHGMFRLRLPLDYSFTGDFSQISLCRNILLVYAI